VPAIISAAEVTDAQAIHPGYGFLSENADFAERVESSGFVFIGPRPGNHPSHGRQGFRQGRHARPAFPAFPVRKARCPMIRRRSSLIAKAVGYPVIIKAAGGGGGRGMRVVHTEAALINAVNMTRAEAQSFLRKSQRLYGEIPGKSAPCGNSGSGRQLQECRLSRRTRLLDAAPSPEDHRGSAGPRHPPADISCASASVVPKRAGASTIVVQAPSNSSTRITSSTSSR
jgi:hypothetical protein